MGTVEWQQHAAAMAQATVHPSSRWRGPLASVPRHAFIPRWWQYGSSRWNLTDGAADTAGWMSAAYSGKRTLVTQVGRHHADDSGPGASVPDGLPTSSSTLPELVVTMYRHAMITDDSQVLVTTGTGYGTALMCRRLGDRQVTSIDVDPGLVERAGERLEAAGMQPALKVCDITGPLPVCPDRIISTVAVERIPTSWLAALPAGGRLVTTIQGTGLLITADKTEDGGAAGRVTQDRAAFMATRTGTEYPPGLDERFAQIRDAAGESITTGRYPVLDVYAAWDVWSMLALTIPGIEHRFEKGTDGRRTAWMVHSDGSWARAEERAVEAPTVYQAGPRRLWDELEHIRGRLNTHGSLPVYGAAVRIDPDGTAHLRNGSWTASIP